MKVKIINMLRRIFFASYYMVNLIYIPMLYNKAYMELRLPLEMSPGREAACRAVFGTWGFFRTMHGKTAPSC